MIKNIRHLVPFLLVVACTARAGTQEPYQGVLELEERLIGFEVGGRLRDLPVRRGEAVREGALLARLDDTLARPVRDARAAEVLAEQAKLELLQAGARGEDVRATVAELDGARATALQLARNLERQRALTARGVAGMAAVEDGEGELARARAHVRVLEERLLAQRKGARAQELAAARARLAAAQAALAAEDERLSRYALDASQAGTVLELHVERGEVVAAGAPVVSLADTTRPYVDVFVPQGQLGGLRVGQAAHVRVDAEKTPFAGRVEHIARKTEFTPRYLFSEMERPNLVVRVRVRVEDPQERLHAGVPAFVTLDPTSGP
jgi:HlyD family secretion protein